MIFLYTEYDRNGNVINPTANSLEANDLGHALQRLAASLSDDAAGISVMMGKKREKK